MENYKDNIVTFMSENYYVLKITVKKYFAVIATHE